MEHFQIKFAGLAGNTTCRMRKAADFRRTRAVIFRREEPVILKKWRSAAYVVLVDAIRVTCLYVTC